MKKTTVYLPDNLKARLAAAAAATGRTEADLVREGVELIVRRCKPPAPTIPLFVSDDPHLAERADEYLAGFGER